MLCARVLAHTVLAVMEPPIASVLLRCKGSRADDDIGGSSGHGFGQLEGIEVEDGGYLVALRARGAAAFLPAIAWLPGQCRLEHSLRLCTGLAECMVLGRPLQEIRTTVLHEAALRTWLPEGSEVEVVLLSRLLDSLELDEGLHKRIGEMASSAESWASTQLPLLDPAHGTEAGSTHLCGTGLTCSDDVEARLSDVSGVRGSWIESVNAVSSDRVAQPVDIQDYSGTPQRGAVCGERYVFAYKGVSVGVLQQRATLESDKTFSVDVTGDRVWPTATIFCRYLCDHAQLVAGCRVLDMGAGTGLVGLVVAALGGLATLVDVPRVLPSLVRNVASASAKGSASLAAVLPLTWGDEGQTSHLAAERGPFDIILCCEVVYQQPPHVLDSLRLAIDSLLARPSGLLIVAYQHRDGAELTDHRFFDDLAGDKGSFELASCDSLGPWDDAWDDMDCRWVRTYRRRGLRRPCEMPTSAAAAL